MLGRPRSDGHDTLSWIAEQEWSNGKVGTIGCSSTAEWIMGLASKKHPAHVAAVPMGQGAGIGRMGPHYEQGNFYKGGAIQLPMLTWLYNEQNTVRPMFPSTLSREELIRVSKYYDLAPDYPQPDWHKAFAHLPLADALVAAGGPNGIFDDMVDRGPDHPDWYTGGLYHDDEDFTVPALWVNSWFDLSVEANTELFNHVREGASNQSIRDSQYMIIAPTEHCHMYRLRDPHIVGDRNMGRVHFGLDETVYEFFDYYMKNDDNGFPDENPRVRYFSMGSNEWRGTSTWPPEGVEKMTLFLSSTKGAHTLHGDGRLAPTAPTDSGRDSFAYDPMNPVPTHGGNFCCLATAETPGSFDQRANEARQDVLVYTSEPLERNLEVSGPVEVTLFVSSDARDTDFTVKLLDVEPDGTAWNLVESIQRARYRDGYDREVFMEPDGVYALKFAPLETSNEFMAGHRIRIEISSSNFPRFERNLNTGRQNARETEVVVATNTVHYGPGQASFIVLNTIER
ncbi:MAG: CocE/NonD family hydrolase [Pseudomonadota bacterium]